MLVDTDPADSVMILQNSPPAPLFFRSLLVETDFTGREGSHELCRITAPLSFAESTSYEESYRKRGVGGEFHGKQEEV